MKNPAQIVRTVLNDPSVIKTSSQAKQLHAHFIKLYGGRDFATLILSIYSNFNLLQESRSVFDNFESTPPTKAWKSIIKCCASSGNFTESITFFMEMRASGRIPDRNVFPSVLKTCAHLRDLRCGEALHGCIIRLGLDSDLFTGNALMNLYAKLESLNAGNMFDGGLEEGRKKGAFLASSVRKVFEMMPIRDVVSWNTFIGAYVQNGMYEEALSSVRKMTTANFKSDSFTLSSVLPIFAQYVDVMKGKEIHGYTIRHGFDRDVFIGSSLIDMYANCTRIEDSCRVFRLSPKKDLVSWNSIIAGCVQNGMFDEGLKLFREMLMANIEPVAVSFSSIIPACAHLTTVRLGKQIHGYIIRLGFYVNVYVASSLLDMYAKCGNIRIANSIFEKMETQDTISWTAMIMAYAMHGHAYDAISFFEKMEAEGVKPTEATFVALLTACSHAGLVDEAWKYFKIMTENHSILPCLEHYAAVSDLLSRAGRLDEAYEFISRMHIKPTGIIWSTLLSACRVHKNVELAEKVAKNMFIVDPDYMSTYVLLSNVYVAAGRWKDAAKLRKNMKKKGMIKLSGCSWIEVKNKVHAFVAGDENHPDYAQINETLKDLMEWMEIEEYIPDIEQKSSVVCLY
ncbi:hypothetical protein RD792_009623 [Penstemon davidsonii]|uniref:Pentatricopeptide repeat-containing protein n=1 Tax=Penstemon davidsonii TaxID=160366 RepID=A0ABR0D0V8_9LAMI|nr:hypothetical protein RD792_009623 [Penstemon davidsonii]